MLSHLYLVDYEYVPVFIIIKWNSFLFTFLFIVLLGFCSVNNKKLDLTINEVQYIRSRIFV